MYTIEYKLCVIIVLVFVLIFFANKNVYMFDFEQFTSVSNEALQTLGSMYNVNNVTTGNIVSTNSTFTNSTITKNLNVNGNVNIDQNLCSENSCINVAALLKKLNEITTVGIYAMPTNTELLNFSQIAIFDKAGNKIPVVADYIKASKSRPDAPITNAIDGVLQARNFPANYHTDDTPLIPKNSIFYEINFPVPQNIGSISIYNRADCCDGRLTTYNLMLKNSLGIPLAIIKLSAAAEQKYKFDGKILSAA